MRSTGDGTPANTTGNLANLTNQEKWMRLCELASNEHDQEKLGALFEQILRLLEDQQARLNIAADGMPQPDESMGNASPSPVGSEGVEF
jgi:hypothetical protein